MKKPKFVNKYENYKSRAGTPRVGEEKTSKEFKEDVDIYNCIAKYGVTALMQKTEAEEYYYDDYNNQPKTLLERVQQRQNLNEYFEKLPARVRKTFGDNADIFYQKFKEGDFKEMTKKGILNDELIKLYTPIEEKTNDNTENIDQITDMAQKTTNSEGVPADTP